MLPGSIPFTNRIQIVTSSVRLRTQHRIVGNSWVRLGLMKCFAQSACLTSARSFPRVGLLAYDRAAVHKLDTKYANNWYKAPGPFARTGAGKGDGFASIIGSLFRFFFFVKPTSQNNV